MLKPASLAVISCLFACGGGPVPVTGTFPLEVGPSGATIEGAAGTDFEGVRLVIPPGALTTTITIDAFTTDDEPELGPGARFVGPSFGFSPRAQVFAKPVTLTLPVFPTELYVIEQTTRDCLTWLRAPDESWGQAVPVSVTEETVTVEANTLIEAAVGARTQLTFAPPHPLTLPCTSPAGFCVGVNPTGLKPRNFAWSKVTNGLLLYQRTESDGGVLRSFVTEYDLVAARHTFESQAYTPPATTAPNFAPRVVCTRKVVRGPDDAGWAPAFHGLVRYPLTGAPTLFPDSVANGKTMAVAFTSDGRRHRQLISVSTTEATMRVASTVGTTEAAPVVLQTSPIFITDGLQPFEPIGRGEKLAYFYPLLETRVAEVNPPAAGTPLPLHPDLQVGGARSGVFGFVVSDDGDLVAISAYGYPAGNLFVQSRDGGLSRAYPGLPRSNVVEFGEPGFLYVGAPSAAHVYRVELATGAIQTIELTSSTEVTAIQARVPQALRHVLVPAIGPLPEQHVVYVIAGEFHSNRSVLSIRRAP